MRPYKEEIIFFKGCEDLTSVDTLKKACVDFFAIKQDDLNAMSSKKWESLHALLNRHLERRESISIRAHFGSCENNADKFYGIRVGALGRLYEGMEGRVLNPEEMINLLDDRELEVLRTQEKSKKIGRKMRLDGSI